MSTPNGGIIQYPLWAGELTGAVHALEAHSTQGIAHVPQFNVQPAP
ncbi:hypothetical protein QFZ32_000419 [Streptomyces canus]|nr:hypothetical protein [Streptomyces canus]MDQ1064980.1 hypothetical protein [Streptomyces canus]